MKPAPRLKLLTEALTLHEMEQERRAFLAGVEVTEMFSDVPHVRTDIVIKPTGAPPAHWGLQ